MVAKLFLYYCNENNLSKTGSNTDLLSSLTLSVLDVRKTVTIQFWKSSIKWVECQESRVLSHTESNTCSVMFAVFPGRVCSVFTQSKLTFQADILYVHHTLKGTRKCFRHGKLWTQFNARYGFKRLLLFPIDRDTHVIFCRLQSNVFYTVSLFQTNHVWHFSCVASCSITTCLCSRGKLTLVFVCHKTVSMAAVYRLKIKYRSGF